MIKVSYFAGAICEGASCAPLFIVWFMQKYGLYVLGGIIFTYGIRSLLRSKGTHQNRKQSILILIVGILLLSATPIIQSTKNREVVNNEKNRLTYISFPLYDYEIDTPIYSRSISTFHKPASFLDGDDPNYQYDNPKYAYLADVYKLEDTIMSVYQFNSELYKGKPETCSPQNPEFPDNTLSGYKCAQVGTSAAGTPIFASLSAVDQSYIALFTSIGATGITVEIIHNKPSINNVLLHIMKTLKQVNKSDIKFVVPTTNL